MLEYNTRAIRAYEKCGFVREGIERETALVDGAWHGDVIMSLLEDGYRAQPWAAGAVGRPIVPEQRTGPLD